MWLAVWVHLIIQVMTLQKYVFVFMIDSRLSNIRDCNMYNQSNITEREKYKEKDKERVVVAVVKL